MKEFWTALLQAVIIAVVPVVAGFVCDYLREKAKEAAEAVKNERVRDLISEAVDAVYAAVAYVGQRYVDELKKSNEFSVENQATAFEMACTYAYDMISSEAEEVIESVYGDVDEWLEAMIEKAVREEK